MSDKQTEAIRSSRPTAARLAAGQAVPVARRKTYELVAERLLEDVVSGALGPGALVPAEIELAEALRVGRSSVREALRLLESRGLITREGSGRFSVVENINPVSEALNVLYDLRRIEVEELFDLRRLLEVECAGVAAERRTADDLKKMGEAVAAMRWGSVSQDDLHEADTRFHVAIAAATQNRATALIVEALRQTLYSTLHRPLYERTAQGDWSSATVDEHIVVLDAISAQDADAARAAMGAHLDRVGRQALANLERATKAPGASARQKD